MTQDVIIRTQATLLKMHKINIFGFNNYLYFKEWEDEDKWCCIMVDSTQGVAWEVETIVGKGEEAKFYDGVAETPMKALAAIQECISNYALGEVVSV